MITTDEIRAMLLDIENDRVERTISTTNTDKFGQAICAFANDLPNHKQPGYLFLGVTDDGAVSGINVTDELLKNIAPSVPMVTFSRNPQWWYRKCLCPRVTSSW